MYEIKNYMEILVEQMFGITTQRMDICKCDKCKLDIMAIALNSLKPRYVVTTRGNVYVRLNMLQQQFNTDIIAAITTGAMMVGENPYHDK